MLKMYILGPTPSSSDLVDLTQVLESVFLRKLPKLLDVVSCVKIICVSHQIAFLIFSFQDIVLTLR